ncbi:MAG: hypothetical protein ACRDZT_07020 [Acidimicrobiales bacterium]
MKGYESNTHDGAGSGVAEWTGKEGFVRFVSGFPMPGLRPEFGSAVG